MATTRDAFSEIVKIDAELNKIQDYDLMLERILLEARRLVKADAGSIYIKEGDNLAIKYSQNDTKERELPPGEKLIYGLFSIPIDDKTISGYVAKTGQILDIPDVYDLPPGGSFSYNPFYDKTAGYKSTSMLAVPLKTNEGQVLGVIQMINATSPDGRVVPFTVGDETIVTHFAANAASALQRAHMTRAMILRMIKMAELRDPKETGAHVNRVAGYAVEIFDRWAFKTGMKPKERERLKDDLKLAAMLHDVGKVAISDLILKKPARFTPDEYSVMQAHTYFGARLFDDPQSQLDSISADVALTHHECWDGSGYPGAIDIWTGAALKRAPDGSPLGLKGEQIPLGGRIVAVADVYDALMSRRAYKEAWDEDAVLGEIKSLAGIKFDPAIVDVFFEILPRIKQIRARYPDAAAKEVPSGIVAGGEPKAQVAGSSVPSMPAPVQAAKSEAAATAKPAALRPATRETARARPGAGKPAGALSAKQRAQTKASGIPPTKAPERKPGAAKAQAKPAALRPKVQKRPAASLKASLDEAARLFAERKAALVAAKAPKKPKAGKRAPARAKGAVNDPGSKASAAKKPATGSAKGKKASK